MKTNYYIDAFNLYYGSLKGTPFRWLNLEKLFQLMLPKNKIHRIRYFTALVKAGNNWNKGQDVRQQVYLRALKTLPSVDIILGHYLAHKVMMPVANPKAGQKKFVRVIKTEEKGSDVNLATHLLNDAYKNDFDVAVVVSNDSDLVEPIKIVVHDLKKPVGIINPQKHPSAILKKHASFIRHIRKGVLSASQFQTVLQDSHGKIKKPTTW